MGNCVISTSSKDVIGGYRKTYSEDSLNSFKKQRKIGKGAFSIVWQVRRSSDGAVFAMKEMLKARVCALKCIPTVLNERRLLSRLRHEFFVNMCGAFQTRDHLYLVLDHMTGGDLRYYIGNHALIGENGVRFLVACILSALEYLHYHGYLHGDLKPENLVFDEQGYLRLTDFGTARRIMPDNCHETAGTPHYLAPEIMHKQTHTLCADFFSLGVITYELAMGRRPFKGKTRNEVRESMGIGPVQLSAQSNWSAEGTDFVNQLLEFNPSVRLGSKGVSQVKEHPWLADFEWDQLLKKQLPSQFVPKKTENFYKNYVKSEFKDRGQLPVPPQECFLDYSYNPIKPMKPNSD